MNLCFTIGKIVSNVEFNFLYNSKFTSIAKCKIMLNNKSVIKIFGYDDIADFLYSKIRKNNLVFIYGMLLDDVIQVNHIVKI